MNRAVWESQLALLGPRDHILAVGALALTYNDLESVLYYWFQRYLSIGEPARALLFGTLNNNERVLLIRRLAESKENSATFAEIDFAMTCYDICCENRNLLLHAIVTGVADNPAVLDMIKAPRGKPEIYNRYHLTLDDIIDATVAMLHIDKFMFVLHEHLDGSPAHPSLPERPPQPRKLNLSQLREDPAA